MAIAVRNDPRFLLALLRRVLGRHVGRQGDPRMA
jgi:hypothetical protein